MTHYRTGAMALVAALLWPLDAAHSSDDWVVHENARYGLRISFPASLFAIEKTSEAGDGHIFYAAKLDARLLAGVLENQDGHSPASYLDYIFNRSYPGYTISYKKLGSSWFALSGKDAKKIFYEKVQFSCSGRLISSFAVIYPIATRAAIDPVIERMEDSFRSARHCSLGPINALAPPAPPLRAKEPLRKADHATKRRPAPRDRHFAHQPRVQKRAQKFTTRSEPRRSAQRRYAKGRPVIIVLRRRTPPYDLRFVRGYVANYAF
jgi:hypothetical protein